MISILFMTFMMAFSQKAPDAGRRQFQFQVDSRSARLPPADALTAFQVGLTSGISGALRLAAWAPPTVTPESGARHGFPNETGHSCLLRTRYAVCKIPLVSAEVIGACSQRMAGTPTWSRQSPKSHHGEYHWIGFDG